MTSPADPVAVFDIDGTLSDTRHRLRHLRHHPKDWDAFFAAAPRDGVHPEGLALVRGAVESRARVVYLTGRPRRLEKVTRRWLARHDFPDGDLVMRADTDRRSGAAFKLPALRRLAASGILAVLVDDDPDVIAAVRQEPDLVGEALLATWQPFELPT